MRDHRRQAREALALAEGLYDAEVRKSTDTTLLIRAAFAAVHALLAISDAIASPPEIVDAVAEEEPEREDPTVGYPRGSAGLCMAAFMPRPGSSTTIEHCHFPNGHTGPHSWATSLGETDR